MSIQVAVGHGIIIDKSSLFNGPNVSVTQQRRWQHLLQQFCMPVLIVKNKNWFLTKDQNVLNKCQRKILFWFRDTRTMRVSMYYCKGMCKKEDIFVICVILVVNTHILSNNLSLMYDEHSCGLFILHVCLHELLCRFQSM